MWKARASSNSKADGGISTVVDRLVGACLSLYTIGFIFFRIGELVPLFSYYSLECKSALIGTIILRRSPLVSQRAKYLLHVLSMVALVYIVDNLVPKSLPIANATHSSKTVVITGANSGVGYETARQLAVNYGANVIMGCRSDTKCKTAANTINAEIASSSKSNGSVTPLLIDLSNLDSVKSFALQLEGRAVDVLFNNAGYVPEKGMPVNSYGLDPAFSSMHLAHFYLTELMLKENPSMRVVNTSSGTHHTCAIPFNLPSFILKLFPPVQNPGCIDEEYLTDGIRSETDEAAYIQSKLANVMHVVEIPRRHRQARSVAIDLGWVETTILPFMEIQLVKYVLLYVFCCVLTDM